MIEYTYMIVEALESTLRDIRIELGRILSEATKKTPSWLGRELIILLMNYRSTSSDSTTTGALSEEGSVMLEI